MRTLLTVAIISLTTISAIYILSGSNQENVNDTITNEQTETRAPKPRTVKPKRQSNVDIGTRIYRSALSQIGKTVSYDPSYVSLSYPNGDVPISTGVCTDVVVRALRGVGLDLQKEIHEDMKSNFNAYPNNWGLSRPDRNIDHRRVPNQMKYFERNHAPMYEKLSYPGAYRTGDIIVWKLNNNLDHTGVISEKRTSNGEPYIIHNIGRGAVEEAVFSIGKIIGHYRVKTGN